MSSHNRPGGLTALAVLNFIFGGLGVLGIGAFFVILQFADQIAAEATGADQEAILALKDFGTGLFYVIIAVSVIQTVLLIAAGVGYLKLRPWGRTLGNVYGILGVGYGVVSAFMVPPEIGGGINIGAIIGLIYPVLTLALLNTVFKEDFASA